MAHTKDPQHVLIFAGVLSAENLELQPIAQQLITSCGDIFLRTEPQPFTYTTYYQKEMGEHITRQWWVFDSLHDPSTLAEIKTTTNAIEQHYLNTQKGRSVNIDPGLISLSNVVLASTKNYSHRIYLGKGIYAEVTLVYKNKSFTALGWTYPDYRESSTIDFFNQARTLLKEKLSNDF
jgi:hypothetical protein